MTSRIEGPVLRETHQTCEYDIVGHKNNIWACARSGITDRALLARPRPRRRGQRPPHPDGRPLHAAAGAGRLRRHRHRRRLPLRTPPGAPAMNGRRHRGRVAPPSMIKQGVVPRCQRHRGTTSVHPSGLDYLRLLRMTSAKKMPPVSTPAGIQLLGSRSRTNIIPSHAMVNKTTITGIRSNMLTSVCQLVVGALREPAEGASDSPNGCSSRAARREARDAASDSATYRRTD